MKLPQDKKKRMQIFALAGVFALAGLYGIFSFVVQPMLKSFASCKREIAEHKEKIEKADKETKKITTLKQTSADLRSQLRDIDARYVLTAEFPKLRNFEIRAREKADQVLREANIPAAGSSILPVGEKQYGKGGAVLAYVVTVSARLGADDPATGYSSLTNLLGIFESRNPYVTVTELKIETLPDKPGVLAATFNVRWPVWADPDIVSSFAVRPDDPGQEGKAPAPGGGQKT